MVLEAIRPGAATALDVGCGDGLLTFDLADRGLHVTGLDVDRQSIDRASRNARANTRTSFVRGDIVEHPFVGQSFDVVASISMLHHTDARRALQCMRELVRPGGDLVVVGFARPSSITDRLRAVLGGTWAQTMKLTGRYWEHHAPTVWPPPCTMAEMRRTAAVELPTARFRSLLPERFAIVWSSSV